MSRDRELRTVTLADLLRVLVRGAPFALAVTALAVVTAVVVTRSQDPVYSASVAMVVTQSAPRYENVDLVVPPVVDPSVYRTAIYDGGVLRSALESVEGRTLSERELESASEAIRVTVESQDLSSVIRVAARDTSPERAARIVNAVADALVLWDQQRARQRLEQSVAALERAIASIDAELAEDSVSADRRATLATMREQRVAELALARDAAGSAVAVALIEPLADADPPELAVGPRIVLNTAVALVLGLVAGYGLLLLSWTTHPRVGHREDLARFSNLPVLAEFAHRSADQQRLSDEGTSWLRTRLAARREVGRSQMLVVAGLRSAEDKDGVAVGLAESFARGGDATLLVDADLRSGRASAWLGVADARGTPYDDEALVDAPARPYAPVSVVVDRDRTFDFLPALTGAAHPVDRLVRVFDEHREAWLRDYDVVIVDAAPLLPHADALAVTAHADGVVLCARRGRTSRADLERALALLREQRAPVVGTVLTHAVVRGASPTALGASRRGVGGGTRVAGASARRRG